MTHEEAAAVLEGLQVRQEVAEAITRVFRELLDRQLGWYLDEPYRSVAETAKALHLSRSSTYEAIRRGDIPSQEIAGRRLVPTAQVAAQLLQSEESPAPKPRANPNNTRLQRTR